MEYIPDNLDDFEQHEREDVRHEKRLLRLEHLAEIDAERNENDK